MLTVCSHALKCEDPRQPVGRHVVLCALQLSHHCCSAKLLRSPKFASTRGLNVLHCVADYSA